MERKFWGETFVEAWIQSYARHNYGDPHAHFAMLLREDRETAKKLCYEFIDSRRFLSHLRDSHMEE